MCNTTKTNAAQHPGFAQLLNSLALQPIDDDCFSGVGNVDSGGRVYGGQVLAQAVIAAYHSVGGGQFMHVLQSSFLLPGDLQAPLEYRVTRLRDGRSFCARRVDAWQHGSIIFTANVSFHVAELGPAHGDTMPQVPQPEALVDERERIAALFPDNPYAWPVEYRHIAPMSLVEPTCLPPRAQVWFRAADAVPGSRALHDAVFAYASDNPIMLPALNAHGITPFMPDVMLATLNHAIWFHGPIAMDDWSLFDGHSDFTGGGRGMGRGRVFSRDGVLRASVMQEGLLRSRPSDS